ncbi:unnamed protein product [Dovyalis caffra]|uniref:Uncharacterized protein n=1 Tax=Dovyalis caffra TaxID=77055 RepID=A0AAV1SFD9_9ROSI|nr:unnamed protein product [Dovyalis caffra]
MIDYHDHANSLIVKARSPTRVSPTRDPSTASANGKSNMHRYPHDWIGHVAIYYSKTDLIKPNSSGLSNRLKAGKQPDCICQLGLCKD